MIAFFTKYGIEIVLSLITAGALAFCRHLHKRLKDYKKLIEEKGLEKTEEIVDSHLEPLVNDIEELRRYIINIDTEENRKMTIIISSYRYRLIALCKMYLKQGFITSDQYDQLTEFYKLYSGLGGNGQAKEYYEKTIALPFKKDIDDTNI